MTDKEIINELCAALINRGCERVQNGEAVALDSYMRAALDAADALESILRSRWTPVTEALPPEDTWVLATVKFSSGDPIILKLTCVHSYRAIWEDETGESGLPVTAWMPLPIPFGGEENERRL